MEKLTVKELRAELTKRSLETAGLKTHLVKRLRDDIEEKAALEIRNTKVPEKKNGRKRKSPDNDKELKVEENDDSTTEAALEGMTVKDLQAALSERGLPKNGTKRVLINRLIAAKNGEAQESEVRKVQEGQEQEQKQKPEEEGGEGEEEVEEEVEEVESEEEKKMVVATKKGRVVLDSQIPSDIQTTHHVLAEGEEVYDAMLNQTNTLQNNNKFFLLQLLEADNGLSYKIFYRWGRVGHYGQKKIVPCDSKISAQEHFESKFFEKTKNRWENRYQFVSKPGKYTWLQLDYEGPTKEDGEEESSPKAEKSTESIESKLDPRIFELIQIICDPKMMKQQMVEIGYDAKKMPLGKLSRKTVLQGFEVLKQIAAELENDSPDNNHLALLSSNFYTVIPHDFGFRKMRDFIIKEKSTLKKKLEMVEALAEIEVASRVLEGPSDSKNKVHPVDEQYGRLHCQVLPLTMEGEEAHMIKKYVANTHATTHSYYKLEVEQIFKVEREGEDGRFKELPERKLLWHGSRLSNWTGILSQGLRIAPPEAPVTGYMFGKGVYFADMVSKSANYCYAQPPDTGLLLLCEVSLGDTWDLVEANYEAGNLPQGKNSTKGLGKTEPNPKETLILSDGLLVPLGSPNISKKTRALLYNEYIVYDVNQIRMRYLLQCRFLHP